MLDVVEANALDDGHVVGGQQREDLLDLGHLGGGRDVGDGGARKDGGLEGALGHGLLERGEGGDVGLAEPGLARGIREPDETTE